MGIVPGHQDLAGEFAGGADEMAVIEQGHSVLSIISGQEIIPFELGFAPIAVATGDIDQDQLDEVVVLGAKGNLAVCDIDEDRCELSNLGNDVVGLDVTVADVDGDGFAEPVLLLIVSDVYSFYIWNRDYVVNAQSEALTLQAVPFLALITAGDIDGDGTDEIFALEHEDLAQDTDAVSMFRFENGAIKLVQVISVALDTVDLQIGGLKGTTDLKQSLVLLRDAAYIDAHAVRMAS
ncbi:MAG: hypothetical protein R3C68_00045 [Myxococcota bacterium]